MAHYIFVVNVRTDDTNVDATDATAIRNELLSTLEWGSAFGIEKATVREVANGSGLAVLPCGHAAVTPCVCGWDV